MAGGVDYDRAAADFHHTRGRTAALAAWRAPVVEALAGAPAGPIVDLGAGTGAWSAALAEWTGRRVLAVEPSAGMRAEFAGTGSGVGLVAGPSDTGAEPSDGPSRAESDGGRASGAGAGDGEGGRVALVGGRGGAVPLRRGVGGAAWLSTVIHHVGDLHACAGDLAAVLAPRAPVLIRSAFPGRYGGIPIVRYFPEARRALDRFPSVDAVRAAFEAVGFRFAGVERIDAPPVELAAWREMLPRQRHADTVLVGLSDAEFAAGVAAVDAAIAAGRRSEVVGIDLLTFAGHR